MRQLESKEHNMFIQLLQSMIKSHGHDIKLKTVEEFVHIVREICPWVPEGGFLDEAAWNVIGEKIEQFTFYNKSLPQSETLLSVWSKLCDCVCPPKTSPPPTAPPYASVAPSPPIAAPSATLQPPLYVAPPLPNPHDLAERGSNFLHSGYPPLDDFQPLAEVLVDETWASNNSPQWTPGPVLPILTICSQFYIPSIEVVDNQGEAVRNYDPIAPKVLCELKEAVSLYGPTAPYTLTLLDNLAFSAMPPADWGRLTKASLSGGDFLLWKAYYEDGACEQSQHNRRQQSPIIMDMLMGRGQYEDLNAQIAMPTEAFVQINGLAVQAWRQLSSSASKTEELAKIRQGPDKLYQDFASHLLQAVSRQVGDEEAGAILVRQLAFENANTACQAAIRPWPKKRGFAMAAAQAGMTVAAFLKQKPPQNKPSIKCYRCGGSGYVAKTFQASLSPNPSLLPLPAPPSTSKPSARQPGECPRCHHGNHWANKCRSKCDAQGNALSPWSGNSQRGLSRPPQQFGATNIQTLALQRAGNPFLNSNVQPQTVQDLTSVPPPNSY
ncbi:Gag polyprotein [Plecturocebus cupreus]